MIARNPKTYSINLIRELRTRQRREEQRRRLQVMLGFACFAALFVSILYCGLTIWKMESVLGAEKVKLDHLQTEYKKYTATRMIVSKEDVELLNSLQSRGIFWTRKLASLASHLPENYWITNFTFRDGELRVYGFGYASARQDQLLTLDAYLNRLRADTNFSDVFSKLHLNITERKDEPGTNKVGFDFSALTKEAMKNR